MMREPDSMTDSRQAIAAAPARRPAEHPLAKDALGTLRRLHDVAAARAVRQQRRLTEERDALPRGPLPVTARAAAASTEALHLLIALAALGDQEARQRLRPARAGAVGDRMADWAGDSERMR